MSSIRLKRDDPYWITRKSIYEQIELYSVNNVSLVQVFL